MTGLREQFHKLLCDAVPDEMVIKWVLGMETITGENLRQLYTLASPDATSWDIKGILQHLKDMETVGTIIAELKATDDDD